MFVLPDLQLLNGKNGKAAIRVPDHKLFAECFVVYNVVILICLMRFFSPTSYHSSIVLYFYFRLFHLLDFHELADSTNRQITEEENTDNKLAD